VTPETNQICSTYCR